MREMPTYEMRPVRRGSIIGRFVALCWVLALVCFALAYATAHGPDDLCCGPNNPCWAKLGCDSSGHWVPAQLGPNLTWLILAFLCGGAGLIVGVLRWLVTGRVR